MPKKKENEDKKMLKEVVEYMQKKGKKLPKGWEIENGMPVYYEPEDYMKSKKKK